MLLRTASSPPVVALAEAGASASGSGSLGEVKGSQPEARDHARDHPGARERVEQRATRPRSSVRWWVIGVGQWLPVVALVLVGAFGLWSGASHEEMGPLERSRLAVLPFIDLSAEPDQAYFGDGMIEELIAQLSQIPGLTVIARTSVMKYKSSLKDVATIGRELQVGTVLEGSIRKLDKQVRVSVQLIDVASQGHLWSQEYIRELTGIFATQNDIATHLAQGLKVQLTAMPIYNRLASEPRFAALGQKIGPGR
jgi:TolB-like protein